MKKKYLLFLILIASTLNGRSYVTYQSSGGRLGDELLSYVHAKWISYKYGLTLLYKPFKYSDKFMLSDIEHHYNQSIPIAKTICPKTSDISSYLDSDNVLLDIPFFTHAEIDKTDQSCTNSFRFEIDWDDLNFKKLLQEAIKPKVELSLTRPPQDIISIALHVRKNSGDWPLSYETIEKLGYLPNGTYMDLLYPLKSPPDSYYIEQLKKASEIFNHASIYIYIFTDYPNPASLAKKYQDSLKDYNNLIFDYRKSENHSHLNVLEDFFSISTFDCLIRPDSNFSIIASKIGNFKLIISPKNFKRKGNTIIIDEVSIESY